MQHPRSIVVATSVHPTFDGRIWKHCKSLAELGITVHLVCPWNVPPGIGKAGVVFHPFFPASGLRERLLKLPARIHTLLRELVPHCQVLHIHDPDLLFIATAYRSHAAIVYDCHENFSEEIRLRPYIPDILKPMAAWSVAKLERHCVRRFGNVVMAAPAQERHFSSLGVRRILIGNLASRDLLSEVRPDWSTRAPALVFIGTQHVRNGSLLFLEIAAKLSSRHPELRYVVSDRFPDPEFKKEYVATARDRGLLDKIDFVPNVPAHQIMETLNRATIAINPNLRIPQQIKGNHTKMYEFMAAGLPVVCSDLPHQKTIVEECECGLLAQPEDIDSFVIQIERLLANSSMRLEMGEKAQVAFKLKYSYEAQMPALLDFYTAAIQQQASKIRKQRAILPSLSE